MNNLTDLRKQEIMRAIPRNNYDAESWAIILSGHLLYRRIQTRILVQLGFINDVLRVRAVNPQFYKDFTKELDILVDDLLVLYGQLWALDWVNELSGNLVL